MSDRRECLNAGWVFGTHVPFPTDPAAYLADVTASVPCNQLVCDLCHARVKHVDGAKNRSRWANDLSAMYEAHPATWSDQIEQKPAYRLYYCQCGWYATPGANQVGHLDTHDIDGWGCAGHPAPGA